MSEDQSTPIQLNIYDLSQGLAAQISLPLIGIHLKAIYHTSVTVYNTEYFFNSQGIMQVVPLTSHFGKPIEIRSMGETFIPQEIFQEFLQSLDNFKPGLYELFENNCNDFTKICLEFLNDGILDEEISGMSMKVLKSEKGEALRNLMMGFMP